MDKKIIFSGIQPSGNLTIGNYLGALLPWVKMQNTLSPSDDLIFCIVDLHAITVPQDPKILKEKIREIAAIYIACGINPKRSDIFVQSENLDHPYLAWIFDCITPFGWMQRMTQFKDKSAKQHDATTVGLFNYPALMASDILLYDPTDIPVGEDQRQHIELTRDVAIKFNNTFGETFIVPKANIQEQGARVMSLQNPESKMSKSDENPNGAIALLDEKDAIVKKIKRAVTDSGTQVDSNNVSKAIENLLGIYAVCTDITYEKALQECEGMMYGQFKQKLADVVVEKLEPIQQEYHRVMADSSYLDSVLDTGLQHARARSQKKIAQVNKAVGLGRS